MPAQDAEFRSISRPGGRAGWKRSGDVDPSVPRAACILAGRLPICNMEAIVIAPEEISKVQAEKISVQAPPGVPASLLTQYIDRCLTALPAAKTALDRSDYGHVRVFGHRLKGSGGAYGIPVLTTIGSGLEDAARRGDMACLRSGIAELEAYLGRIEVLCQ